MLLKTLFLITVFVGSVNGGKNAITNPSREAGDVLSSTISHSPSKIADSNDTEKTLPFIKKFQHAGEWFKNRFQNKNKALPEDEVEEDIKSIKMQRAHSWQSLLFLIHVFLIFAGAYFSVLRTFMIKHLPEVKEVDAEENQSAIPVSHPFPSTVRRNFTEKYDKEEESPWSPIHNGESTVKEPEQKPSMKQVERVKHFDCTHPFDENGVLYYLGCDTQNQDEALLAYKNPHIQGRVTAKMSSLFSGSEATIVAHSTNDEGVVLPNYTDNLVNSWISLDLGEGTKLRPTTYCIRHGASLTGNAIRSWELRAKESEGDDWDVLREHVQDESLSDEPFSTALWDLNWPDNSDAPDLLGAAAFRSNYANVFGASGIVDSSEPFRPPSADANKDASLQSNYSNLMGGSGIVEGAESDKPSGSEVKKDVSLKGSYANDMGKSGIMGNSASGIMGNSESNQLSGTELYNDAAFQSSYANVIGASGVVESGESDKPSGADLYNEAAFQSDYANVIGASGVVESGEPNQVSGAESIYDAAFKGDYVNVIGATVFQAVSSIDAAFRSNYANIIGASGIVENIEMSKKSYRYFMIKQTGVNSSGNDCLFIGGLEFYGELIIQPVRQ